MENRLMDLKPLAMGRRGGRLPLEGAASGCVPCPPSTTFIHNSGGPGGHAEDGGCLDSSLKEELDCMNDIYGFSSVVVQAVRFAGCWAL